MSSKQAGPSLIQVPLRFSIVESGVYRCASPTVAQIPFLSTLNLKTIISLTPEHPIRPLLNFTRSSGIDFCHLGVTLWQPSRDWKPMCDELVKAALELVLDRRNRPVLLVDPSVRWVPEVIHADKGRLGIHHTGCVVGALRMMQRWNFASILVEYRAHSGPTQHRYSDEQCIELFDPDIINLPPCEFLPYWFQPQDEDSEEGSDGETKAPSTAKREVDGVVQPGDGEAKEGLKGVEGDARYMINAISGVG